MTETTEIPYHEMSDEQKARWWVGWRIERWVPPRYLAAETDNVIGLNWAAAPHDICYISGPVGAGKTYLAWALTKHWFRQAAWSSTHSEFQAFHVGLLLHRLRPGNAVVIPAREGTDEYSSRPAKTVDHFGQVCRADLLLLDDFGADKFTDWGLEQLTTIVNSRYNELKPTIITSNVTPREAAKVFGDRLASRFKHNATVIPVIGADRRQGA